jgi:hypothetical protein
MFMLIGPSLPEHRGGFKSAAVIQASAKSREVSDGLTTLPSTMSDDGCIAKCH